MKKIAVIVFLAVVGSAPAQQWGTIQGQVTWGGKDEPKRLPLNVDKDQANCLRNGKILDEIWVVDSKSKGIKNVMVWLAPADGAGKVDPKGKLEIHPALRAIKDPKVTMDQPCCMFIPQVIVLREGQTFVAKNSDKVPHNTNIQGGVSNPNMNFILPPGTEKEVKDWKAATTPVPISCNVHPWMKAYVRVFNHPYAVVTGDDGKFEIKNAPAGKFRLVVWHPEGGWLAGTTEKDKNGIEIKIDGGKTTEVPAIKVTPDTK